VTNDSVRKFQINQGWNTGHNPSGAAPYLEGMARILKIRIAKDSERPTDFVHPPNRVAAESLVLFTWTLSFYYLDVDRAGEAIEWDSFSIYLEPNVFSGASMQTNSPLLGSNWELYRIIIEIVRLSHNVPLDSISWCHGRDLELELNRREEELYAERDKVVDVTERFEYVLEQTLLYVLVT
jgi:hypothetical protein